MRRFFATALLSLCVLGVYDYVSNRYTPILSFTQNAYSANNPSNGFADLVEKLSPAVVNISTTSSVSSSPIDHFFGQGIPPEFNDLLENFLGGGLGKISPRNQGRSHKQGVSSLGSGFVIDPDGYIVTNHHVVDNASKIEVNFPDGATYKAEIIGSDAKTDLALVKIIKPEKKFIYVDWGNSTEARVGEWVVAIGNPYGLSGSVSAGIISAVNRNINAGPYDNFIQTDAAINRGNSGGPLFNMNGEVIGVNSAIISPSGGSVGVGFSIPANLAKNVIEQIKDNGVVERGRLGIYFQPLTQDIADALNLPASLKNKGVLIGNVEPDGPADKAGLQSGDIIVKVNETEIIKSNELPRIVASLPINNPAALTIYRNGKLKTISVNIAKDTENQTETADTPTGGKIIKDIGITVTNLNDRNRSLYRVPKLINGVVIEDDRQSELREFRKGDVIMAVNQKNIQNTKQFIQYLSQGKAKKEPILFKMYRNNNVFYFALRLK
ncbi:MAG: serine protease Do [Alphaproteobacteria bacterium]|jgi:serine protease Do